ncbi:glycosylhydrolase-like jelly roll fold domain-containing protein [Chitinophaga sedimenti]|uniref:glycosylhydrolase-like jelly roll fold domain-containing protein n=1 Tax=Chitinophaga sedimenti TaxID=2033606 RepID=UPI0027DF1458|nr:glycosylhydrolase-like jelly roll fold domain-containing protein [Chitinophaga sedimenti]
MHRRTPDADIYYVVNRNERPEYVNLSFRIKGRQPEVWDPIKGTMMQQTLYTTDNERVQLPMFLPPFGSTFVVFRKPVQAHVTTLVKDGAELFPTLPADTFAEAPFVQQAAGLLFTAPGSYSLAHSNGKVQTKDMHTAELPLNAPWQVSFSKAWGGPENIVFDRLISWPDHTNDGIKYYAGTAVYRQRVNLTAAQLKSKVWLDLGAVYNIAEVHINGRDAGVWWAPPFTGDISAYVKEGGNELEIKIVNLWPNRIIGDQLLPEDKRFTKTNVKKFGKDYPLRKSGLLGPVRLRFYE